MALITSVGDANSTLFWTDNWLHGKSIAFLPQLFSSDSKRRAKRHTVCEAMVQNSWVLDIQGALSATALSKYLEVWDLLLEVQLHPNTLDQPLVFLMFFESLFNKVGLQSIAYQVNFF